MIVRRTSSRGVRKKLGDTREKVLRKARQAAILHLMATQESELQMVDGFLAGDRAAGDYVETCIQKTFRRWQGRFGFEADDILSDIRYKLLISLRRGDFAQKSSLSAYINGITNHTCIDYLRFRKRVNLQDIEGLPLIDNSPSADERLEKKDAALLIFRVLRLVPKECLHLWKLLLREGLKCAEIGERLGKSAGNIRRKLWECRKTAKEIRESMLKNDKRI